MDISIFNGANGRAILSSDTLVENGDDLRLAALRYAAISGAEGTAVLEVAAGEVFGSRLVTDFMGRLRGWVRGRLDARQLSSPRVLILQGDGPVSLIAESTKADWHYIVVLCPCAIEVGESRIRAGGAQLFIYKAAETARIQREDNGGITPGVVMDGLAW